MKILFLDIDGVLNSRPFLYALGERTGIYGEPGYSADQINENSVTLLNRILNQTGAKVVVSSSWRAINTSDDLQEILDLKGFTGDIIGCTPRKSTNDQVRGDMIQMWLDRNTELNVESFIILDDEGDMGHLISHLVKTELDVGLTDEHVTAAVNKLK